ncbi:MAG: hypothetical protein HRU19_03270 [Pseudobacteriovorax sp.]|nr:hypothetical protein [Pseudobacteriovorax sp.]
MQVWQKRILEIDGGFASTTDLSRITRKNRNILEDYLHKIGVRSNGITAAGALHVDCVWDVSSIQMAIERTLIA